MTVTNSDAVNFRICSNEYRDWKQQKRPTIIRPVVGDIYMPSIPYVGYKLIMLLYRACAKAVSSAVSPISLPMSLCRISPGSEFSP